ncbi:hypothetical protein MCUN1_002059 [Malassezia cuniculi]|uniref:non-specific serine/threonine protein kinase n=1 Tax=Malassezia cuniculi TaxID=948313 RepID=A0AAF0EVC1_9BASI|nr:hypothetical protein MCUN1_002059 [Malassezia cuniculi]
MSGNLRVVGNYTLQRTIGQGTFGRVRRATHRLTNTHVAVKQIPKAHIASLTREIHHHRRLQHPNIVQLFEVLETESSIWLVAELCSGGELYDYLVERGTIPEPEARVLFGQLCLAVAHIHSLGIVHRDLKLENILLDAQRNVKLSDFGFSREFEPRMFMDTRCGTTAYAAPEMLSGKRYLGESVDIWSLGIILFVLLCGYLPFDDDDERVMRHHIIKSPVMIPISISSDAQALIHSILQKDPSRRPSIRGILSHSWFSGHVAAPLAIERNSPLPAAAPLLTPAIDFVSLMSLPPLEPLCTPIAQELLQQLAAVGFSVSQMRHSVATFACDSSGALWWLLFRKAQQKKDIAEAEAARKKVESLQIASAENVSTKPARRSRTPNIMSKFKSWISNDNRNEDSMPTSPAAASGSRSPFAVRSSFSSDEYDDERSASMSSDIIINRMRALEALEKSTVTVAPHLRSQRQSFGSTSSIRPPSARTSLSERSSIEGAPLSKRHSATERRKANRQSWTYSTDATKEKFSRRLSYDELKARAPSTPVSISGTPRRPRSVALHGSPSVYFSTRSRSRPSSSRSRTRRSRSRTLPRNPSAISGSSGVEDAATEAEPVHEAPRRPLARRQKNGSEDDWVDVDDDKVFGGIGQVDISSKRDDKLHGLGLSVKPLYDDSKRSQSPVPAFALGGSLSMLGQPIERPAMGSATFPGSTIAASRALKARRNMNTSVIEEE